MLFVIVDGESREKVLLVKADSSDEVEKKLQFTPSQKIAGSFTSAEYSALESTSFGVISA